MGPFPPLRIRLATPPVPESGRKSEVKLECRYVTLNPKLKVTMPVYMLGEISGQEVLFCVVHGMFDIPAGCRDENYWVWHMDI